MATKEIYLASFAEEEFYHIFNRTNNKEPLFLCDENRRFFLRQYDRYLSPFVETYCYCLLTNHFHFLVRVKSREEITKHLSKLPVELLKPAERQYLRQPTNIEQLIEAQWHRFFTSYSMAFNKRYNRSGNFFNRPFKRMHIASEVHLTQAIVYIHCNPLKHNICKDFQEYAWSSFKALISSKPTKLQRQKIMDWFGNEEKFIKAHSELSKHYYIRTE